LKTTYTKTSHAGFNNKETADDVYIGWFYVHPLGCHKGTAVMQGFLTCSW